MKPRRPWLAARGRRALRLAWLPAATLLAGLLVMLVQAVWPALARWDDALADQPLRWRPPPLPWHEVLVLDIDEASLRTLAPAFGGWPLPREAYALVIEQLREAGARAVAIDVVLADRRSGDERLARTLGTGGMPVVLAVAGLTVPFDPPLREVGEARRAAPAPAAGSAAPAASQAVALPAAAARPAALPEGIAWQPWPALLWPSDTLRAGHVGMVSLPVDDDGVLRRLAPWHGVAARGDPGLAGAGGVLSAATPVESLAALPLALHQALLPSAVLQYDTARQRYQLGPHRWPADAAGRLRLPALPVGAVPRLPFREVALSALGQGTDRWHAQVAGRSVFIGSSAALDNPVPTPGGPMPATEWLAAAHLALGAGQVLPPAPRLALPALLLLGLLPGLVLCGRGRPRLAHDLGLALGLALLLLAGGAGLLLAGGPPLPMLLPLAMLATGAALAVAAQRRDDRLAAERLRHERTVAEAANAAKSEFLASMSHELRTPLNGVIGACQLLQDHGGDEQRRDELLDIIRASSNHLLGLIDGVLHLARIEAGVLELVREDFNLVDAIEAVVATAASPARSKGLQVACVVDPRLPAWRHGDVTRLRQVLLNLMGNAVKFTLQGEVVLRIGPGTASDEVVFAVNDTGIGLDAAARQRIFEPFAQADSGTTRRFGGSGLGLTICRKLVLAMGGSIGVESTPGQGACFTVRLQLPAAREARAEPPPLGYRVAFVEPHEASAEALQALLERMGCQALRCTTPEALHAAASWPDAVGRPAWLLVATDEPEALALMESAADWIDPERVVGMNRLSWYAADAARDRVRLPRSVIKPVLRSALVSRLGVVQPAAAAGEAAALQPRPEGAARVLVVEDDPVNQAIVAAMLGQAGFHVEVAGDGAQALLRCAEADYGVVLMDWQMPDMDGIEVTRRLRDGAAGARARSVPVVALTANAFAEDRAACLAAGMNDFLSKPVVADDLIAVVQRWVLARRG